MILVKGMPESASTLSIEPVENSEAGQRGMGRKRDPNYEEAIGRLRGLFDEARARGLLEPAAATLATTNLRGQPSIRTITVAAIDAAGPVFFVDVRSGKARQMEENPCAAICFFWPELHRQVVIEGHTERTTAAVSERCWTTRPREAQLASWLGERDTEGEPDSEAAALAELRRRFGADPVPRPPHWQAVQLQPDTILFWRSVWREVPGRERYARDRSGRWRVERLEALHTAGT